MRFWPSPESWRAYWAWARRFLALYADSLVVAAGVFAASLIFRGDILADTRPEDPLVVFAILIVYFSVANSRLTRGRSIGKRLTGLHVVGVDGSPVSLGRSVVRAATMFLPLIVAITDFRFIAAADDVPGSTIVYSFIVVGMGGAAFYLVFAVLWSGRALHDLVANTYVLPVSAEASQMRPLWRVDIVAIAAFFAISIVLPFVPLSWFETWEPARTFAFGVELQRSLASDRSMVLRGYESDAHAWYSTSSGWITVSRLHVSVHAYGSKPDLGAAIKKVVLKLMAVNPDLTSYSYLSADATYGSPIDMGRSSVRGCYGTPQQWRDKAGECPNIGFIRIKNDDDH